MGQVSERLAALSHQQKSQLFKRLRKHGEVGDGGRIPSREGSPNTFPLSFAQQRLWFLQWLERDNAAYNLSIPLRLSGPVEAEALGRSLNEIRRRHETLRTRFEERDGEVMQVVDRHTALRLPVIDLRTLPRGSRESESQKLAREEAQRPFDLGTAPLVRWLLYQLDEEDYLLLITMHHIISDGWSIGVFVSELMLLYEALTLGYAPRLPDLPVQYVDFAKWQHQRLQGNVLERLLSYWRRQLDGAPTHLDLPTDFPRPHPRGQSGAIEQSALPAAETEGLRELSRNEDATLSMTVLTVFVVLLHHLSRDGDIVVGCNIANRNRIETEGLIGFFVNQLALRIRLGPQTTARALVRQVRGVTLGAFDHQDLPFQSLVDALGLERDLNRNPLFQVMFAFQNTPMPPVKLHKLRVSAVDLDNGTAAFDLALLVAEQGDGIVIAMRYSTELFSAATVRRMLEQLALVAREIVADPDAELEALTDKLSDDDKRWRETQLKQRKTNNIGRLKGIADRRVRLGHLDAAVNGAKQ